VGVGLGLGLTTPEMKAERNDYCDTKQIERGTKKTLRECRG
jgi:hypothetical protein